MQQVLKRLAKDSAVYGLANIIQKLLPFVLIPFITKHLGKTAFRLYDLCFVYAYLFSWLIILGQDAAASVYYFDEQKERFEKRQVLTYAFWLQIFSALFFLACFIPFRQNIAQALFARDADTAHYWLIAVLIIPGHIVFNFCLNVLLWQGRKKEYLALCCIQLCSALAGVFGFVLPSGNINQLFYVLIGSTSICAVAGAVMVRHHLFSNPFPLNKPLLKKLLAFGLPFAITAFLGQLIPSIDRYFILHFNLKESLPTYSLAVKIGGLVTIATSGFLLAFTPYSLQKLNGADAEKEISGLFHLVAVAAFAAVPVVLLFRTFLVGFFANETYSAAAKLLPYFLYGWVFDLFGYFSMMGLYRQQRSGFVLLMLAVSTGIIILLNLLFIPIMNSAGAALSFCLVKVILFLLPLFYFKKEFHLVIKADGLLIFLSLSILCTALLYHAPGLIAVPALLLFLVLTAFYLKKILASHGLKNYFGLLNNEKP